MPPFVSKRGVVKADELMSMRAEETLQHYGERLVRVVGAMCESIDADAVNVVCLHAFLSGGVLGGGERSAHTVMDYAVPPAAFPGTLHYVAAGHLHRFQEIGGACPIRYSGSPLQLDFGEEADTKGVVLVEAAPGLPAEITFRPLRTGRPLVTVTGSLESVEAALAEVPEDAWVRVRLDMAPKTGLADQVRELHAGVVDVQLLRRDDGGRPPTTRRGRAPRDLFADYLAERGIEDPPVEDLFAALLDEVLEETR
jgi:exonuclease SbcD